MAPGCPLIPAKKKGWWCGRGWEGLRASGRGGEVSVGEQWNQA